MRAAAAALSGDAEDYINDVSYIACLGVFMGTSMTI